MEALIDDENCSLPLCVYVAAFGKSVCICDQIFQKGSLYMYSFKTYFSSVFDNYVNGLTAHVFKTVEGWTICF